MEKDVFLTLLSLHLSEGDMPKDEVDKRVKYFDNHLSELSKNECEKKIDELGGDKKVAAKLLSDYRKSKGISQKPDEELVQQTADIPKTEPVEEKKQNISELLDEDDDSDVKTELPKKAKNTVKPVPHPANEKKAKPSNNGGTEKKGDKKSTFNVGLILLSPIILICLLIIACALASLFVAVAVAVVLCAAALVLFTALGTAFSVVAIIYGITQIGTLTPAGIYEIGIGILCGGVTMLVGILLYNLIVRLAPFVYKKLVVLVKFVIKQLKRLYEYAKGVFDK